VDLKLLPSAAAAVTKFEHLGTRLVVDSRFGTGIPWKGGAKVDGQPWPARDDETLWLPAGPHTIEPATATAPRLLHLHGALKSARIVDAGTLEFTYRSAARAIALIDQTPVALEIDGEPSPLTTPLILPRGQHLIRVKATEAVPPQTPAPPRPH